MILLLASYQPITYIGMTLQKKREGKEVRCLTPRVLNFLLVILILFCIGVPAKQSLAADVYAYDMKFRLTELSDHSLQIEGLDEQSKNGSVTLYVTAKEKDMSNWRVMGEPLFQDTLIVNSKGYFSTKLPHFDTAQFPENQIYVAIVRAQNNEYNHKSYNYPYVPKDYSDYYYIPAEAQADYYDQYKDGYVEPQPVDYAKYGVGEKAPHPSEAIRLGVPQPIAIASSDNHVLALSKDGTLYGWGNNENHELNASNDPVLPVTKITKVSNIKKIEAGEGFSLYITTDGKLYGWGYLNRLGVKLTTPTPTLIELIPEPVADISVYQSNVAVLTTSGNMYQLGGIRWAGSAATYWLHNYHRKITINDVQSVAMGSDRAFAVKKDGTLWYWSTAIREKETIAEQMTGYQSLKTVYAAEGADDYMIAIDRQGKLWTWGNNQNRQMGYELTHVITKPTDISRYPTWIHGYEFSSLAHFPKVATPAYQFASIGSRGGLFITKQNEMLLFGMTPAVVSKQKLNKYVSFVEVSEDNMYWIAGGKLWSYGYKNNYGQVGIGVTTK